ncbi:NAD(P)/FAD-dependent oxidoreductase [uncultured Flavonifractor sp.]|uniref:NAD(P)/FAD-dependent oxidoreductase n=1 Tax=uncultured Flavonifractor sp. TaxID=1193534 RepID=UPI00261D526B|nr:NAD(P)/FAD-dependent oxidoreductase [uncultured Flavonifractor sp.]
MYDLIVVGGGPAGMSAACAAWDSGLRKILIVERDQELGGILNQCIHNGFGLHYFQEELTGPEYAGRFIQLLGQTGVEVRLDAMVLEITQEREVHMVSRKEGYRIERARSIVLAMGCRERTRGAIGIPGTRPAGVYTAGAAQRYVNMEGWMPGRRLVILGSGDIGLIMARRMTLEGAKVLACVEAMPYSGGLNRNIVQCLHDYGIPLYLSHTVTDIRGERRLEQVVVSQVDERRNPIPDTEMVFDCDTLLLSVGLIPENELTRQAGIEMDRRTNGAVVYENMETSLPGVFACGNVCHVHALVDFVTAESQRAGGAAARYVLGGEVSPDGALLTVKNGGGVTYTVPQRIRPGQVEKLCQLFFRVNRVCGDSEILVTSGGARIAGFKREHLSPGEMEQISLPKVLLDRAAGELTVSVREVEGK